MQFTHVESTEDHAATDVVRPEQGKHDPAVHPEQHSLDDSHNHQHRRRRLSKDLRFRQLINVSYEWRVYLEN